ncbi:FKBP-type peptidyl-prolyl cis-trans isomerase [Actinoplanes subglobosus]|uniref:Peptidyl-prolyl cis-trans isomerase n=1 Tax=Actinoplanes subglobosus TaxID=1547892 RepID=A0ABV8J909_9ACTN
MSDKTMSSSKRRGQAIAGVLSGALVFVVLVVVFFVVRKDKDTGGTEPAAAPTTAAAVAAAETIDQEPTVTTGTGTLTDLVIKERIPGTGEVVKSGQTISVNYKLIGYTSGEEMDSSWENGKSTPISFQIGTGNLIQGWDKGIPGQKVGSRIQLDVPANLAYGPERGDLRFVVDILSAE